MRSKRASRNWKPRTTYALTTPIFQETIAAVKLGNYARVALLAAALSQAWAQVRNFWTLLQVTTQKRTYVDIHQEHDVVTLPPAALEDHRYERLDVSKRSWRVFDQGEVEKVEQVVTWLTLVQTVVRLNDRSWL